MGSVVGTVANGLAAPFQTLFGTSCENVCSGTWDLPCFNEHVCLLSLAKLFVVLVVTYVVLLFGYLLVKLGVVKCVAKNACKVVWKPLSACCLALGAACCLLLAKVRDTKRVYRGRRGRRERDVELGESGTSRDDMGSPSSSDDDGGRRRRGVAAAGSRSTGKSSSSSVRERRNDRIRHSLRLKRVSSKVEHSVRVSHGSGRHHHRYSTGSRRREASSLSPSVERVYGSAARGHSHVHRRIRKSSRPRQYVSKEHCEKPVYTECLHLCRVYYIRHSTNIVFTECLQKYTQQREGTRLI